MALQIDKGDDETLRMAVKSPEEADALPGVVWSADDVSTWGPLNLTGCKLWLHIKTNAGEAVLSKTSEVSEGITITDALGGLAEVAITSAETAALDDGLFNKSLRLEAQVRSSTGRITTLARSTITILRDRITAT